MIKTKEFALTPEQHFRILARGFFRQRWWVWMMAIPLTISVLFQFSGYVSAFFVVSYILVIANYFWYYWRYAHSEENRNFFQSHHMEVTDEYIEIYEDDNFSRLSLDSLIRVQRRSDYMLLYVAKNQFFYVPYSAFESQDDIERFNALLHAKGF